MSSPKTVLVTGANRGIGFAIAKQMAQQGFTVLLAARNKSDAQNAAIAIGHDTVPVELDLSDLSQMRRQMSEITARYPSIDALINNAAVLASGHAMEVPKEDFHSSMHVNVTAPFELIRHFAPFMISNTYGRIVNISSGWGSFDSGLTGPTAYSVSKAALNALTLSFSQTLPDTVKINAMCPGWVRTRMGGESADRSPTEAAKGAVWLATLGEDGPTGGFFRDQQSIKW